MYKRKIEDYLLRWKEDPTHKPIVIKGVRQCGKTSSVKAFAKAHYKSDNIARSLNAIVLQFFRFLLRISQKCSTFAADFIPRMVAIATKFEVNGTYGYTKKYSVPSRRV